MKAPGAREAAPGQGPAARAQPRNNFQREALGISVTLVLPTHILKTVVIGAGQAGLAAAHHLRRAGMVAGEDFVVLDSNDGPGGAWRHRWDSLTFGRAHAIHDLPGLALGVPDPTEPAREVVKRYYGEYEEQNELNVLRPVQVKNVFYTGGLFKIETNRGTFESRTLINATGTWESPYIPYYPGINEFTGQQLHTKNYRAASDFVGKRVLVVGGGTSALQFLQDLNKQGIETVLATRRTVQWTRQSFNDEWGLNVEREVAKRVQAGKQPLSVSAVTGIGLAHYYTPDIRSGLLLSRGNLVRLTERGAVLNGPGSDGSELPDQGKANPYVHKENVAKLPGHLTDDGFWETPIDVVLWATGFRANIGHLAGLKLREKGGGILLGKDNSTSVRQPGLFMAGYGSSASTLGATRAGRRAARGVRRHLERELVK